MFFRDFFFYLLVVGGVVHGLLFVCTCKVVHGLGEVSLCKLEKVVCRCVFGEE